MKHRQPVSLLLILAMYIGLVPPVWLCAQAPAPGSGLRIHASRGAVELQSTSGQWVPLQGEVPASVGTAVRTAPGAEMVATFQDGSTLTLGAGSALKVTELAMSPSGNRVGVKVLGEMAASLSPARVSSDVVTIDTPIGRATIGKSLATGRATRAEGAAGLASIQVQTPTGRATRAAVLEGVASMQALNNFEGTVTDKDEATSSFTLNISSTRKMRIVITPTTQLATKNADQAATILTPKEILEKLDPQQKLICYGDDSHPEGPAAGAPKLLATILYPQDSDALNAYLYLAEPTPPTVGPVVVSEKGSTLSWPAQRAPVIISGIALVGILGAHAGIGAAASAGAGAAAGTAAAGTAVATAAATTAAAAGAAAVGAGILVPVAIGAAAAAVVAGKGGAAANAAPPPLQNASP